MRRLGLLRLTAPFDSLSVSMDHRVKPGGDEERGASLRAQRSNPVGLREKLDCFVATAPRNDEASKKRDKLPSARSKAMKEPTTPEEVKVLHDLLRSDPQRYLQIVDQWIAENPSNSHAYFDRHMAWMKLGDPQRALDDLNMVVQIDPKPVAFWARGDVYRRIGEYEKALEDLDRAEAIDPAQWAEDAFGLVSQADCHARLGNEVAALACCARLHDDFWTGSIEGAPGGSKAEIAEKLRVIAAAARGRRV
jgi:tetratricopeptide (TPR) repeat protein